MTPKFRFAGLKLALPTGWLDITDDLPSGSPSTLAREDGAGALQFSVARYGAGKPPNIGPDDLRGMLDDFSRSRALSAASEPRTWKSLNTYISNDYQSGVDFVRVWYVTNGKDVTLVTFVTRDADSSETQAELGEADSIVASISF